MQEINGVKYKEKDVIMDRDEIQRAMRRIADEIIEKSKGVENLVIIGLQTRGVFLAERIAKAIEKIEGESVPTGVLDNSLYRDDLGGDIARHIDVKETHFPFEIDDKTIVLIDDVLFTGRSVRAAIDCIMDFGRPACIMLGVLIDRGHRELPIQADFVGKQCVTKRNEVIAVELKEVDTKERVLILEATKKK